MPKIVLFNCVNFEGGGDFSHFEDILKNLQAKPRFSNVDFTAIISVSTLTPEKNFQKMQAKVEKLGISAYFEYDEKHENLRKDEKLCNELKEADLAVFISFVDYGMAKYKRILKKGIPYIYIGEHECNIKDVFERHALSCSMGLSKEIEFGATTYGIKIKDVPPLLGDQAWEVIEKNSADFAKKVLGYTHCSDFDMLRNNHLFMPAYFNNNWNFIEFLRLFSINNSYLPDKDILILHSGHDFIKWLEGEVPLIDEPETKPIPPYIQQLFNNGFINQIEIYQPSANEPRVIKCNPNAKRTIRILSGYQLNDPAYEALYHLAELAGVSGDNTFEYSVALKAFPFYYSTNFKTKRRTLEALKEICQLPELEISDEARKAFTIYFDPNSFLSDYQDKNFSNYNMKIKDENFTPLNLQSMVNAWPIIADYLKQNRNFYNQLESIILSKLPLHEKAISHNSNKFFELPKNTMDKQELTYNDSNKPPEIK